MYEWLVFPSQSSPIIAFSSTKSSPTVWHHKLGHLSSSIYKHIVSTFGLELSGSSNFNFNCNFSQCNKTHKLPFSTSSLVSYSPLEIIFSDVWTSPIYSVDGFKYYVIFVNHFTKYICFYPLKQKSNVCDIFVCFKALVKNYLKAKIVTLYYDQGGEYQALKYFLALHVISTLLLLHIHLSIMAIMNAVIATLWKHAFLFFRIDNRSKGHFYILNFSHFKTLFELETHTLLTLCVVTPKTRY